MPDLAKGRSPAAAVLVAIPAVLLAVLALEWALTRSRAHETPRWREAAFAALRLAPGGPAVWDERWVVAVHPGCPHCRTSLASLAAARDRSRAAVEITALIVDARTPPPDSAVAHLPADETRWDARGRWRRAWGHRVYGEILCFDPAGVLRRVLPPFLDAEDAERGLVALGLAAFPE